MAFDWKSETTRLDKMNYLSDYTIYEMCKERIIHIENQIKICFDEVCQVKHLAQITSEENIEHLEELKFIEEYFKKEENWIHEQVHLTMLNVTDSIYDFKIAESKNIANELTKEINEIKYLITVVEKELRNLGNFLNETLIEQFRLDDNDSYRNKRKQHYEKYINDISEVMIKKAEKINSLRRNSFAFVKRTDN